MRQWMKRFGWGLGMSFLALLGTLSWAVSAISAQRSLIVPGADRSIRVDPSVLDLKVREVLGVSRGDRLFYEGRPNSFSYPDPDGLEGMVTVEGKDPDRRTFHMGLVVMKGPVMVETFYFDVRVGFAKKGLLPRSGRRVRNGAIRVGLPGVQSGDTVRILAIGNGFVITLAGIAQESGRTGDRVTVFNPISGARLQGEVTGPDRVRIRMEDRKHAVD